MTENNPQISLDLLVRRRKNPDQVYRVLYWVNAAGVSDVWEPCNPDHHPFVKVMRHDGPLDKLSCDIEWSSFCKVRTSTFWETFVPCTGPVEYLAYYDDLRCSGVQRMYCTGIPGDDNPLGGIGHQGCIDAAATAPTFEDIRKVVAYLNEAIPDKTHHYLMREVK